MPESKILRTVIALPALVLVVLFSSCAAQPINGDGSNAQNDYTNPGRPETYNPEQRSYEKPWPFGDMGNGH